MYGSTIDTVVIIMHQSNHTIQKTMKRIMNCSDVQTN